MKTLLPMLSEETLAFTIMYLLLVGVVSYVLLRERTGLFWIGLLRLFLAIVYAPFIYVRRAMKDLSEIGVLKGEPDHPSKQYLLTYFLNLFNALIVLVAMGILANGAVSAYRVLMPPKYLRDEIGQQKDVTNQIAGQLKRVEDAVKEMEEDWNAKRQFYLEQYKQSKEARKALQTAQNDSIQGALPSLSAQVQDTYSVMTQLYGSNGTPKDDFQTRRIWSQIQDYVMRSGISQSDRELLLRFNDNWLALAPSQNANEVREEEVRMSYQPKFQDLRNQTSLLSRNLQDQQLRLRALEESEHYDLGGALMTVLLSVLILMGTTWISGVVLELLWLNVHLAKDVQSIKEQSGISH